MKIEDYKKANGLRNDITWLNSLIVYESTQDFNTTTLRFCGTTDEVYNAVKKYSEEFHADYIAKLKEKLAELEEEFEKV